MKILLLVVLISTIRTVNYGIYTIKDKNKTGGVGLFIMAFFVALTSIYFIMK